MRGAEESSGHGEAEPAKNWTGLLGHGAVGRT
jgi:hypothetical protein